MHLYLTPLTFRFFLRSYSFPSHFIHYTFFTTHRLSSLIFCSTSFVALVLLRFFPCCDVCTSLAILCALLALSYLPATLPFRCRSLVVFPPVRSWSTAAHTLKNAVGTACSACELPVSSFFNAYANSLLLHPFLLTSLGFSQCTLICFAFSRFAHLGPRSVCRFSSSTCSVFSVCTEISEASFSCQETK